MCSLMQSFEMYTGSPRLKALYYRHDETDQEHARRVRAHRQEQQAENVAHNTRQRQAVLRIAAERVSRYTR